jgi:hypothetical protein
MTGPADVMAHSALAGRVAETIRHPLWQGMQEVAGLCFDASLLSAAKRSERMFAAWHVGCRAYRFEHGDALLFAEPQTMACERAPGLPLVPVQGTLYSGPLTAQERAALLAPDIALVQGAHVVALRLAQAMPLDLSADIDISDYALHDTYDCQLPPPKLSVARLKGKGVRAVVGDAVAPASEESQNFLRRMRGEAPAAGKRESRLRADARDLRESVVGGLWQMLSSLLAMSSGSAPGPNGRPASGSGGVSARQTSTRPQRWRSALARLAMASRVSRLLGHRQGAHLRRMLEMFDQGDLREALRNALPLNGLEQSTGQAFGLPQRRNDLRLSAHPRAGASIDVGDELREHLRKTYRAAFEKCDREGRIDEAVFVLAELLNARLEALDYLVKHERHAQAAELALGWDMPPATIIRLLMLAGDSQRAVQVARRDNAFAEAVHLLEPTHPALAVQLRKEWGQALAQGGDWLGAVNAIWPVGDAREQAMQWLLTAERAHVELSARALVQRAVLLPDTLQQYASRIEEMAEPTAPHHARTALAEAMLVVTGGSDAVSALATAMLPALAADVQAGRSRLTASDLEKLMKRSGDSFLKVDVPAWPKHVQHDEEASQWQGTALLLQAPAAGLHRIYDVAVLRDRRYLVALGEAGVAVLDARGRIKQRYAVPAYQLVLAESGFVALALARREHITQVTRVTRLDLVNQVILDMGVLSLQFAAPSFNGLGWTVVVDNRILVLDVAKGLNEVLWHVGDLPGPIVAATFTRDKEIFLVRGQDERLQEWIYASPGRRLQPRPDVRLQEGVEVIAHATYGMLQPKLYFDDDHQLTLSYRLNVSDRICILPTAASEGEEFEHGFVPLPNGLAVNVVCAERNEVFVIDFATGHCVVALQWAQTLALISARDRQLVVHDAEGRVVDVDVAGRSAHSFSMN